ncbi:hypothetical protein GJ496_009016 [Pomphorhynchus laevis]|nr:hypothetical protein GJ496_009016 [Pomphorhynchus laevis]
MLVKSNCHQYQDLAIYIGNINSLFFVEGYGTETNFSDGFCPCSNHIVLVDLDNWGCFFRRLFGLLDAKTKIEVFAIKKFELARDRQIIKNDRNNENIIIRQTISRLKNTTDYSLCLRIGQLHEQISEKDKITIISGDKDFVEVLYQLNNSRSILLLNPHKANRDVAKVLDFIQNDRNAAKHIPVINERINQQYRS